MNNEQLQAWVEDISLKWFGLPFRHRATFNRRLTATGGRYFTHSHHIEISWKQYEVHGDGEVEKIIKHELCHYHLHLLKRGYRHRDPEFKEWLQKVGGTRYCRPVKPRQPAPMRYQYQCKGCGTSFYRRRKVNLLKYVCGGCNGKLKEIPLAKLPES
ncbi:SprT family protein [Marinicrinis sediminis]|uniref:SprT family protein n=1 Tax=Marinicrinis sediminis TaxID=1652465 RepID=A0ABW5R7P5_9BACL